MDNHVFLSYSFADVYRARRLRTALRLYGIAAWPRLALTPGSPAWEAEFEERLKTAACVVLILTPNSGSSRWVSMAIDHANRHRVPVVPVVMSGDAGHVLLTQVQGEAWFDLRWSRNLKSELSGLVQLIRQHNQPEVVEARS